MEEVSEAGLAKTSFCFFCLVFSLYRVDWLGVGGPGGSESEMPPTPILPVLHRAFHKQQARWSSPGRGPMPKRRRLEGS